ncbi:D-alanyl-D-alanine carboxypeptidase [Patescibacteria group bacterium]|nr:D-alanyl-D-alanine carboxypeptidase [Patescibacteria group bacterium]MBP9709927.1 D-alanyl-D-alanine carboxypeptidase [Patescibacteria group bacterium]
MFAESFVALASLLTFREARMPVAQPMVTQSLPVARYIPGPRPPVKKDPNSFGIETTARAAVVMDVTSGEILYEKNAEATYPIASLTKLVTAMTVLDQKRDMEEVITILREDDPKEGKSVFPTGEQFTREELLKSLLVGSVNTAGNTLARAGGGMEPFVAAMNVKVQRLGMHRTHLLEPTGLDSNNQASAHDVAIALRAALHYPEIRDITKISKIELIGRATGKPYLLDSTNLLLSSFLNKNPYKIVAGKTGSLPEAGYCLAQATQDKQGHEVIVVVLGSDNHFSRFQDAKALTFWTFEQFTWPEKGSAQGYALPVAVLP